MRRLFTRVEIRGNRRFWIREEKISSILRFTAEVKIFSLKLDDFFLLNLKKLLQKTFTSKSLKNFFATLNLQNSFRLTRKGTC